MGIAILFGINRGGSGGLKVLTLFYEFLTHRVVLEILSIYVPE